MIHNRRGGAVIKLILFLLPFVLVFSIIWLRSSITALEYQLGQLQLQKIRLINEKSELIAKRAELTSVRKVEVLASKRIGLGYTDRTRVFYVKEVAPPVPYTASLNNQER